MKITAAVLEEIGRPGPYAQTRPLNVCEIDLAEPRHGEVLLRVAAAGLCHSDLSVINGDRPRPVPMVLGHEGAGIVERVGEGVGDLVPGDHVVFVFVPSCGHCVPCQAGRPALCEPGAAANGRGEMLGGGTRLSRDGQPVYHLTGVSSYATHAVLSRNSLVKIDREVPLNIAALMGCAVLTGAGAVFNTGAVAPGGRAAVVGLGGVGLAAVLGAAAAGAETIVAVDTLPAKLDLARDLGATHCFEAGDPDLTGKIKEATQGGVDAALEFAGSARALESAFSFTRRGGTTITAGLPNPKAVLNISPLTLVAEERSLRGSYLGSGVPSRDIPRFLGLFKRGKLAVDKLLTHRITLQDVNAGFDRLHRGEAIRQVIEFEV
ncbi:zinc-dependent alcohol dehydrogenase family protein [Bordetella hinzii]|uniref:Alcohol dehydrogenase n=4 Tax=Bordetella hinzii TaxID=103855 RepID=A0AAN1VFL5_9BORD|nr:zinc-dependent alcohol dehydrogenase family protein [Bordetella hinzii]AKQ53483.1 Putative alcohol dehydrogenase D [Bordetella hinzii]AKQ58044.1 Putative alcohol dehydrogenase D [Bordetella hinzii]AZW16602.1 alcohol dehydrogenase [Bordetella hinzii]KCB23144.1 alcohol dehydrogenase, catalytic domain protein, GroES-like family [Bordetella hinzii OH87 BAL007II]KCB29437.1 alcohol dehydrogenase, catalytic domain protein, GroES-like family [Bordetella hinzii L60]